MKIKLVAKVRKNFLISKVCAKKLRKEEVKVTDICLLFEKLKIH
jgi:hypothetical protein